MKITTSQVTALVLSDLDNPEPGRGTITIRCWDACLAAGWPAMSGRSVEEFFVVQNDHYLAKNLSSIPEEVTAEGEVLAKHLQGMVCSLRRSGKLSKGNARGMQGASGTTPLAWMLPRSIAGITASWLKPWVVAGGWWLDLPTMPNPDYLYLCRIIQAVRDGLRKHIVREG